MSTSERSFLIELYKEYLEEASFLYGQRLSLLHDPEIPWMGMADFEDRFESHIDGLVVGNQLALEICRRQAAEGDFGELHAAIRVFCRQKQKEMVRESLEALDPTEPEKTLAVTNALKHECPNEWFDELTILSNKLPKLVPILAPVAGWRRLKATGALLRWFKESPGIHLRDVIRALGRIQERAAAAPIAEFLLYNENSMRSAAALTLLRIGDTRIVDHCMQQARSESWPLIPLGLGAGRTAAGNLLKLAAEGPSGDCLLALGLLGEVSAVPLLISKLSDSKCVEGASQALDIMTGARLSEEIFVPEKIDEDELFEEERKRWKEEGKVPTRIDGKPFGSSITRLSQNPQEWQKWWSENQSRFSPKVRYRSGKPYSPGVLLQNLESASSSRRLREFASEELAIRYGVNVPFEVDMLVTEQKLALAAIAQWVRTNGMRFQEGEWYFAGSRKP